MAWYTFSQPLTNSQAQDEFNKIFMTLKGAKGLALFGRPSDHDVSYFIHVPAQMEADTLLNSFLVSWSAIACNKPQLGGKWLLMGHTSDSDLAN